MRVVVALVSFAFLASLLSACPDRKAIGDEVGGAPKAQIDDVKARLDKAEAKAQAQAQAAAKSVE